MKYIFSCILVLVGFFSYSQNHTDAAVSFVISLKAEAPSYHGIPLNEYFISDLDHDGTFEVIERLNRIRTAYVGFLNVELDAAFTYDKIYILKGNEYVESDWDIARFLELQLSHYSIWKKNILNPMNLSDDSKNLINENKESFLNEIDFIIQHIEEKIK